MPSTTILATFPRTLTWVEPIEDCSLTSLKDRKLVKIGTKIVSHEPVCP
jgi:hypothetical protein